MRIMWPEFREAICSLTDLRVLPAPRPDQVHEMASGRQPVGRASRAIALAETERGARCTQYMTEIEARLAEKLIVTT